MAKQHHFGIEIETCGLDQESLARAIAGACGGRAYERASYRWGVRMPDGRTWGIVDDCSIEGDDTGEVVSPVLTRADIPMVQAVVRALRAAGAKVNPSCGLHVHVGDMDCRAAGRLLRGWIGMEASIVAAVDVYAERLVHYTKVLAGTGPSRRATMFAPMNEAGFRYVWYGDTTTDRCSSKYDDSRYHTLNLHSWCYRGTVEFRLFNGTLHAGEVRAYLELVLAMADRAERDELGDREYAVDADGMRDVLTQLGITDPIVCAHLLKRLDSSISVTGDATPADGSTASASRRARRNPNATADRSEAARRAWATRRAQAQAQATAT